VYTTGQSSGANAYMLAKLNRAVGREAKDSVAPGELIRINPRRKSACRYPSFFISLKCSLAAKGRHMRPQ
jgi:hypothetical protein